RSPLCTLFPYTTLFRSWAQGLHDAAVAELRKAVVLGGGPVPLADLGCLLSRLGRKAEAQQVLEDLGELGKRMYVQPPCLGFVHRSEEHTSELQSLAYLV